MPTVGAILNDLCELAPLQSKLDFDNVGLLVGSPAWNTDTVLLSLDITAPVIEEARQLGAGLILSHHPLFFSLNTAACDTPKGEKTVELLSNRIAAICMHTNLDAADGGVNDALASCLGLADPRPCESEHICRFGELPYPMKLPVFLSYVKEKLHCNGIRYIAGQRPVCKVVVGGGSCGGMLEEIVKTGCDTFVTADIKYDVFLRGKELGLNLLDAGHFNTENVVLPVLRDRLKATFPELRILLAHHSQIEQYYT